MKTNLRFRVSGLFATGAVLATLAGCISAEFLQTNTAERVGINRVVFINNTPFRASFSYASLDPLDRGPGPLDFTQLRVEANTTSGDPRQLTCARSILVGTDEMVQRVIDTETDDGVNFDPDNFSPLVHFSSAPTDSDAATVPDAGTARGIELRLGVDFSCEDRVVYTFEQDPDAPGGFRIDHVVIQDEIP